MTDALETDHAETTWMNQLANSKLSERARSALIAYGVGMGIYRAGKIWYDRARAEMTYTIAVNGDDDIYADVHEWLLKLIPEKKQRSLIARTGRYRPKAVNAEPSPDSVFGGAVSGISGGGNPRRQRTGVIGMLYDGSREQVVELDGHKIKVSVFKPDPPAGGSSKGEGPSARMRGYEKITFVCRNLAARDAAVGLLAKITAAHYQEDRRPDFRIADKWGGWDSRRDVPPRKLDTVVLRAGQKERLIADMEQFFQRENDYVKLGIPYHRGYLFHGPAGTGKTSIAKALASHFDLDTFYIPLGDLGDDSSLLNLVSAVGPHSLLLLEDIDVFSATRDREDDGKGVSMSGLLNMLDGFSTPHGLITIMTSNHPEVLDEAIVRPGRVDVQEEIGFVDGDQLARMFRAFYPEQKIIPPDVDGVDLSPAVVVETFKAHMDDAVLAAAAVAKKVRKIRKGKA